MPPRGRCVRQSMVLYCIVVHVSPRQGHYGWREWWMGESFVVCRFGKKTCPDRRSRPGRVKLKGAQLLPYASPFMSTKERVLWTMAQIIRRKCTAEYAPAISFEGRGLVSVPYVRRHLTVCSAGSPCLASLLSVKLRQIQQIREKAMTLLTAMADKTVEYRSTHHLLSHGAHYKRLGNQITHKNSFLLLLNWNRGLCRSPMSRHKHVYTYICISCVCSWEHCTTFVSPVFFSTILLWAIPETRVRVLCSFLCGLVWCGVLNVALCAEWMPWMPRWLWLFWLDGCQTLLLAGRAWLASVWLDLAFSLFCHTEAGSPATKVVISVSSACGVFGTFFVYHKQRQHNITADMIFAYLNRNRNKFKVVVAFVIPISLYISFLNHCRCLLAWIELKKL